MIPRGLKRMRKKGEGRVSFPKDVPQGLKAVMIL